MRVLLIAAVVLTSFVAFAQEDDEFDIPRSSPPPRSRPQTESQPQFNLRIHPLHVLIDAFGADLEFTGGQNWSVGPSLSFWNKEKDNNFEARASLIAARGTYTFDHDRYTDGWYAGPIVGFASVEVEKTGTLGAAGKGSSNGLVLGSYGGHQWFWSNFSANVGVGYALATFGKVNVEYITSGQSEDVDSETVGGLIWEVGLNYAW